MKPNSFLIRIAPKGDNTTADNIFDYNDGNVSLYSNFTNSNTLALQVQRNGFSIYIGDRLHADARYHETITGDRWNAVCDNGLLITYEQGSKIVTIDSDFLGSEYVYYCVDNNICLISNRVDNIKPNIDCVPDSTGIFQYIASAYSVGDRTILRGVKKSRPQTKISINATDLSITSSPTALWRVSSSESYDKERFARLWLQILEESPRSVLMLSGGWDSRMLLAGNPERIELSYTHGDLDSREVALAFELAAENLSRSLYCKLQQSNYEITTLRNMLYDCGHAFFPHWYFAAQQCAALSSAPLTSGLLVEHLSGHYGITRGGSRLDKALNLAKSAAFASSLRNMKSDAITNYIVEHLEMPRRPWWCFTDEFNSQMGRAQEESRDDIQSVISEYQDQGTFGLQEVFERFNMEHSSRQYFSLQTKCGVATNGYHHPFADSRLSKAVSEIPFEYRMHYKMSRDIVGVLAPDLLEKPLAATLAKAKRPIPIQELSRGARIAYESLRKQLRPNRRSRLGWNNFQFLNNTRVFEGYIESLSADIWDTRRMLEFVSRFKSGGQSAYSLLDMFSKILTIDNAVAGAPRSGIGNGQTPPLSG